MLRTWLKSFGKLLYKHHMTLLLVGCLTHKSESFRLRFVLFTAIRSVSFPLFPSKPARFFLKCSPSQGHFHLTHSGSIPAGYSPVVM